MTRGLYHFEFGAPLAADHTVHILRPIDDRFNVFVDLIRNDRRHRTRAFADGQFKYAVANNDGDGVSLWFYAFKSINILALTLAPGCPSDLRSRIGAIEWPAPSAGPQ